jgi:hypothetical protein
LLFLLIHLIHGTPYDIPAIISILTQYDKAIRANEYHLDRVLPNCDRQYTHNLSRTTVIVSNDVESKNTLIQSIPGDTVYLGEAEHRVIDMHLPLSNLLSSRDIAAIVIAKYLISVRSEDDYGLYVDISHEPIETHSTQKKRRSLSDDYRGSDGGTMFLRKKPKTER